jgi:hypothetical protein
MLSLSSRESQLPPDAGGFGGIAGDLLLLQRLVLLFPFFIGFADAEHRWRQSQAPNMYLVSVGWESSTKPASCICHTSSLAVTTLMINE